MSNPTRLPEHAVSTVTLNLSVTWPRMHVSLHSPRTLDVQEVTDPVTQDRATDTDLY